MDSVFLSALRDRVSEDLGLPGQKIDALLNYWQGRARTSFDTFTDLPSEFAYDVAIPQGLYSSQVAFLAHRLGYQHFLAQKYPLFTYGSMQPGEANWNRIERYVESVEPARMDGISLYTVETDQYAHAAERNGHAAVGTLVRFTEDAPWQTILRDLDMFRSFYHDLPRSSDYARIARPVETATKNVNRVWVYVARGAHKARLDGLDALPAAEWTPRGVHTLQQP